MELDHVFVFSTSDGREADELMALGFLEAPARRHAGQGTANRTVRFENAYLEIIWSADRGELTSERVAPTGLWERANHATSGWSPFGVCVVNTPETDKLFQGCLRYQPEYLPAGQVIEIARCTASPIYPMLFRLPRGLQGRALPSAPAHPAGASRISCLEFGVTSNGATVSPFEQLARESWAKFAPVVRPSLTLTLDGHRQGRRQVLEHLPLTIQY